MPPAASYPRWRPVHITKHKICFSQWSNEHPSPATHTPIAIYTDGDVGLWSIAVRHTYSPYWQFQSHTFPSTFEYLYSTNKPTFLPPIILNCSAINARALVDIARAVQMIRASNLVPHLPSTGGIYGAIQQHHSWPVIGGCVYSTPQKADTQYLFWISFLC